MPVLPGIDDLLKKGVLKKGSDPSLEIHRLSVGLQQLDELLGGGVPQDRCMELCGNESAGKTLISQWVTKAVQASDHPLVLYMDMERSYDETWWKQVGVDTEKLLVSQPTTAEESIDIMRGMLQSSQNLGLIILDSIAAMTPQPEMDPAKSSEDKTIGLQARVITLMYRQIVPLLTNRTIFLATNQMRENIGAGTELSALPGGRAQRHYSYIIWKVRRESWITNPQKRRMGFYMELTSLKNKVSSVADGTQILLPYLFTGEIDMLTAMLEDSIKHNLIPRRGPYYYWNNQNFMGLENLRNFFQEHPEEKTLLEQQLTLQEVASTGISTEPTPS